MFTRHGDSRRAGRGAECGARVRGRRRGMAQKGPQTNRADESLEGLSGVTSRGVFPVSDASPCASLLLRRLPRRRATGGRGGACASLLSAVDAVAAPRGRATPATALKPDAARFPELEKTRAAVAEAVRDLEGLLPELREQLIRGGASDGAAGADGAGSRKTPPLKKTLVASRAAIPAKLGYVTVALVEHLIELPDTAEGVPHDWVRVSTNKSKKVVRYHPPAVLARAAALGARANGTCALQAAWRHFLSVECAGEVPGAAAATRAAAGLDALCSLAALARQRYCCPTHRRRRRKRRKRDENAAKTAAFLDIREGRHPVLDATLAGGERVVPNSVRLGCFPGTRTPPPGVMTVTNGGDGGAVDPRAGAQGWKTPPGGGDWPNIGGVVFRAADGDARAHGAMRELRPRARHDAHRVRGRAHAHGRRRQPGDGEQHVPGGDVRVRGDPARRRRREALAGGPGRARPRARARTTASPSRTRRSSTWSEVRARREAALPREP